MQEQTTMPDQNSIYSFLKENGLTSKSEADFNKEYADSVKAKELYGFFTENQLTSKDFDAFYKDNFKPIEQKNNSDAVAGLHSSLPYVFVDETNQDNNQIVQSLPGTKENVSYDKNSLPEIGQGKTIDRVIPKQKAPEEEYFESTIKNVGGAQISSYQPEEGFIIKTPEEEKIDLAQNMIDRSNRQINAVTGRGDNTGVGDALRDRNFWTLGASDLSSMIYLKKIAGKLEDGTPLTEGDKALLEAWNQSEQINQQYPASDANIWYKTGKNITDMFRG